MEVNIRKFSLALLIFATIIPSYWFLFGRQILNFVYYIATALFFAMTFLIPNKSIKVKCGTAGIYILSLFLYSLHALWDTGILTAVNSIVSSAIVVLIVSKSVRNYLSIIAALCIYRLSCELIRKKRRQFQLIYVMTILNVLLTVSRSVMLVFIAQQIILLTLKGEHWLTKRKISFLLLIIIGALLSDIFGLGILKKNSDIFNMILQVFGLGSDSYSSSFSSIGYTGVVGDRWNLYLWVILSLTGNWIFGRGTTTAFSYMATEYREKTSIENFYLSTLYHHGIVGLIVMLFGLAGLMYYLIKKLNKNRQFNKKLSNENRLTFNAVMLCIIVGEIISYFMVDQSGEVRIIYICVGLTMAYNGLCSVKISE